MPRDDDTPEVPPRQLMDQYAAARRALHEGLGLPADTIHCDLRDYREAHWMLDRNRWNVIWAEAPFSREVIEAGDTYSCVTVSGPYRTGGLAAIVINNLYGHNEVVIFDERLECTDKSILRLYEGISPGIPTVPRSKDDTTEPTRRAAFAALVAAQDRGEAVAASREGVARQFGLTPDQLAAVEREGMERQWPPLGDEAEG